MEPGHPELVYQAAMRAMAAPTNQIFGIGRASELAGEQRTPR